MHDAIDLDIDRTWDGSGTVADPVRMRMERGEDALRVRVDAPYFRDPPPPGPAASTPGLWNYEVVELFVAEAEPSGPVRYLEVELSPHGHHLVLKLRGVRRVVEQGLDLEFEALIDAATGRWTGEALVPVAWLPGGPHRVNAFAIHGSRASRSYLAWSPLPGPAPDFHQPDRFPRLELPRATLSSTGRQPSS